MKGRFVRGLTAAISLCILAAPSLMRADDVEFKPSVEVHGYMLNRGCKSGHDRAVCHRKSFSFG